MRASQLSALCARPSTSWPAMWSSFFFIVLSPCYQELFGSHLPIRVPADQPTIQQAIDSAETGDLVLVAPGTYHEHIDFHGKAITLASEAGSAATILDGDFSGPVVTFYTGEGSDSVLTGFTVQRGFGSYGSGIRLSGTAPLIVSNVFEANWQPAGSFGAAIGGNNASPIIL